jgi:hypothetical protein
MKTLIFLLLLSTTAYSQSLKMVMDVDRIAVNSSKKETSKSQRVLILSKGNFLGILTAKDTLVLERNHYPSIDVYTDRRHNNQLYWIKYAEGKDGFALFIIPLKPYKREVFSVCLKSTRNY